MTQDSRSHLRSFKALSLIAVAAAVLSFSAISCRQVTDPSDSVNTANNTLSLSECIDQCNKTAGQLKYSQDHLHNVLIFLCKGNTACITAENARYAAALVKIESGRIACIDNCHHQGGLTSGR